MEEKISLKRASRIWGPRNINIDRSLWGELDQESIRHTRTFFEGSHRKAPLIYIVEEKRGHTSTQTEV